MTPRCRRVSLLCTLFLLLPPLPPPSPCFPGSLRQLVVTILHLGAPLDISVGKESTCSAGDPGSIPGSRRSCLPCRVLARVTDVCLAHSKGSINERIHSFIHSHIHSFIHACMHSVLTEDRLPTPVFLGFPCGSAGKESTCNAGDPASVSGLGRSPGEGKGHPLQYFGLENSMHYTGLQRVRHGVAKSQTRLSDFHFPFHPTSPFFRSFFFNIKKNEC